LPTQQNGLPEASHASVAVQKRVYEIELVVEHAAFHQQQVAIVLHVIEQVFHVSAHHVCGRRHVRDFRAFHDAHARGS
jgi:hypothetical protein